MQSLRIYCSSCHKEDTGAVLDEINKVCAEFGIRGGVAQLSAVGNSLITGKRAYRLKWEEKEVTKQVALRLLTMITESHMCESCRETMAEKERKESLRQKFKIIVSEKG